MWYGFSAVSYTHLDVYKRQVQNRLFVRKEILHHWCNWYSTPYLLRRLSAIYEAEPALPYAGDVVETIRRALLQREAELAAKRERERLAQLALEDITQACATLSHPLFLRYFLHNAFYWADGQEENLSLIHILRTALDGTPIPILRERYRDEYLFSPEESTRISARR